MANGISEDRVPIAAEDRFVVVAIRDAASLCPSGLNAEVLSDSFDRARTFAGQLTPVFDIRDLPDWYNDVDTFIDQVAGRGAHLLVNKKTADNLDLDWLRNRRGLNVLIAKGTSFEPKSFDLSDLSPHDDSVFNRTSRELLFHLFASEVGDVPDIDEIGDVDPTEERIPAPSLELLNDVLSEDIVRAELLSGFGSALKSGVSTTAIAASFREFIPELHNTLRGHAVGITEDDETVSYFLRCAVIHAFLRELHQNSLLVEFAMTMAGDKVICTPYHSHAVNQIECPASADLLVGRPGVIARETTAVFSNEIREFESLLNSDTTRERHIQAFLEQHPNFLRGLNYTNIYSQLVLDRDDGSSLRPDFFLEPYDSAWCDILDLKLPNQSIIVGRKDRATLAAGIHEVAAQLREYASYFENDKYREWVQSKYGIRVYRPRLIALVGRDMRRFGDAEIRRAMTDYHNLDIMTFDELLLHVQKHMLI